MRGCMTKHNNAEMQKIIIKFINSGWELEDVYDTKQISEMFINECEQFKEPRKVRYYLDKLVGIGMLCRIKDSYNVFYIKTAWENLFDDEFHKMKTKIGDK